MPRNDAGTYALPAGYVAVDGVTAEASSHNLPLEDIRDDLNTVRPVLYGGTGGATEAAARTSLDVPGKAASETITGDWTVSGDWTFSGALTLPAAVIDTAEIADDAVTRAKIVDAAMSGDDATLITGTAGTSGNLAQWNADGDLVEGPAIIDEDDMASDSATRPPSQQSTKAYVDAEIAGVFAAKCTFNGTGTPAVIAGSGVSSITDNGAGDYTLNFSPALPNANYQVLMSCSGYNDATAANANRMIMNVKTDAGGIVLKSTTQLRITANSANGVLTDVDEIYVAILA